MKNAAIMLPQPAREPTIAYRTAADMAQPLPPVDWRAPGLYMGPGRPHFIVGFGASGKTIFAQDLALCIAGGWQIWGHFDSCPSTVVHFDFEMGFRATAMRYQRLARGRGEELASLGDRLRVTNYPSCYLDSADAADVYARECEGVGFVILDALRGATPATEENSSMIRPCIDNLARVSERTGTTFLIIHHAGKGSPEDLRMGGRGSGAIFDAAGTSLTALAKRGKPTEIHMAKAAGEASGPAIDPFGLEIVDVLTDDGNPHGGLAVRHCDLAEHDEDAEAKAAAERSTKDDRRILAQVRANPGITRGALFRQLKPFGRDRFKDAMDDLIQSGQLAELPGIRDAKTYRIRSNS